MENNETKKLKLNYKRTFIIGFAFFGILLLWQVYDSWCPTFLTELFTKAIPGSTAKSVQYLVGIMMAIDNLAALILLPIFGHLSDKTKTPIGKRMPYILVGTFVCAIAFPFIPIAFHYNNLVGVLSCMFIVVTFAMMYRNPAVALMPDITPKPLRSKANGIINIMGYIGGAFATVLGIFFSLSSYLKVGGSKYLNIWVIEIPFLVGSILMVVSALVLFFLINENKIEKEVKEDMELGEKEAEIEDKIKEGEEDVPLTKANKIMLFLILGAEFFWFMSDNGIGTFMVNYTQYHLLSDSSKMMITIIIGGAASVLGFLFGGSIASKIGRKWTVVIGLGITVASLLLWTICSYSIPVNTPAAGQYNPFPLYLYFVWGLKGFGMSLVHVNSFPMVVELCSNKKIGKFTGFYYASSMAAQTVTPVLLGSLILSPNLDFAFLPIYGLSMASVSLVIFMFVKNVRNKKTDFKKGLEALGEEE